MASTKPTPAAQPLNPAAAEYIPLPRLPPPPTFLLPKLLHILWAPVPSPGTGAFYPPSAKKTLAQPPPPPMRRPKPKRRSLPPRRRPSEKRLLWLSKNDVADYPLGASTTLMIRNIPNRVSRRELMALLAEHCATVNTGGKVTAAFDFLYVPVDFARRGNKGYAFVNFTTVAGAAALFRAWNGLGWDKLRYSSRKIREITAAKLQGEALRQHLEHSRFECHTDEYLPVVLTPACNGFNLSDVMATPLGRRVKF